MSAHGIRDDIPLPPIVWRKYPFPELEVGQSWLYTGANPESFRSSANKWAKVHGVTLAVRKTLEGYRVWRLA